MSSGVGCRRSSDLELLWLWGRAVSTALIGPLAWEPPYAAGVALKRQKKEKKKKMELPHDPAILLLGTYPKKQKH